MVVLIEFPVRALVVGTKQSPLEGLEVVVGVWGGDGTTLTSVGECFGF